MAQLSKRATGTVKWFSGQKGFGFISPDDGGEDLFVHQTSIRSEGFRALNEGNAVEFIIERGGDGRMKAVDVITNSEGSAVSGLGGGGRGGGGRGFSVGRGRGYGRGGGRGGRTSSGGCYNCGKSGHLARECPQQGGGGGGGDGRYGGNSGYSGGGGGGGGGGCYNCGEFGHLARDCPN